MAESAFTKMLVQLRDLGHVAGLKQQPLLILWQRMYQIVHTAKSSIDIDTTSSRHSAETDTLLNLLRNLATAQNICGDNFKPSPQTFDQIITDLATNTPLSALSQRLTLCAPHCWPEPVEKLSHTIINRDLGGSPLDSLAEARLSFSLWEDYELWGAEQTVNLSQVEDTVKQAMVNTPPGSFFVCSKLKPKDGNALVVITLIIIALPKGSSKPDTQKHTDWRSLR